MTVPADTEELKRLGDHPWIEEARIGPGGDGVVVRPAEAALAVRPVLGGLVEEFLEHWGEVYDWTYSKGEERHSEDLDLSGWRASDTGAPLPPEHMREWVAHTVDLVLSTRPAWILELGCGTGLLTHRLRDHVQGYVGADVAEAAVRGLSESAKPGTAFVRAAAHEVWSPRVGEALGAAGFPNGRPDCVVVNSVTQCFPGVDYLRAVLRDAIELVAPGGTVIIGDVRDARLLLDFCRWVEGAQNPGAGPEEIERRAAERAARDAELLFDPPLLASLAAAIAAETGRDVRMSVHPKTMRADTELTRYRFDAVLRIDAPAREKDGPVRWERGVPAARLREVGGDRAAVVADPADPSALALVTPPEAAAVPVAEIAGGGTAHEPFGAFVERRLAEVAGAVLRRPVSVTVARPQTFPERLENVALLAMACTVRAAGVARESVTMTAGEIADALRVSGRHRWILRRWLEVLTEEGMLTRHHDGRYGGLRSVSRREVAAAGEGLAEAGREAGHPAETTRFMLTAMARLPELLRDDLAVQSLLFDDEDNGTADGAYRENPVNRYLNAEVAAVLREVAPAAGPLRVLELGAGVGGTTPDALDALAGREIDYLFTDVSRYFLSLGRERFGDRPGVRFGIFDINADVLGQGAAPGSLDVVLAANVLHNARDLGTTLARIGDLLVPGGLLVFVETTRELRAILTSMQFLMSPHSGEERLAPADPRAGTDRVFLTAEEWGRELEGAGLRPSDPLPRPGHPLAAAGLHLFVARSGGGSQAQA